MQVSDEPEGGSYRCLIPVEIYAGAMCIHWAALNPKPSPSWGQVTCWIQGKAECRQNTYLDDGTKACVKVEDRFWKPCQQCSEMPAQSYSSQLKLAPKFAQLPPETTSQEVIEVDDATATEQYF
jgi:hypothetical protein